MCSDLFRYLLLSAENAIGEQDVNRCISLFIDGTFES